MQTPPGWSEVNKGLEADFEFEDFAAAFDFMTQVAAAAERRQHHPDWSNSYNQVHVRLSTHSAGGVTAKDCELAQEITAIFGRLEKTTKTSQDNLA